MELLIVLITCISVYISFRLLPIEQIISEPTTVVFVYIFLLVIAVLFLIYQIVSEILEIRREFRKYN